MPMADDLSKNLRFSRRQVTKRSFVLSSFPQVQDKLKNPPSVRETVKVRQSRQISQRQINGQYRSRDNADLSKSSPLAVLIERDENASPSHEDSAYAAKYGSDSFQKNNKRLKVGAGDISVENRTGSESFRKKVKKASKPIEETPPLPPVEISYLASTPKPGKQQLLRQRSASLTGSSRGRSGHKLRSPKQSRSAAKQGGLNNSTVHRSQNLSESSSTEESLNLRGSATRKKQVIEDDDSSVSSIRTNKSNQSASRKRSHDEDSSINSKIVESSIRANKFNQSASRKRRHDKDDSSINSKIVEDDASSVSSIRANKLNQSASRKRRHDKEDSSINSQIVEDDESSVGSIRANKFNQSASRKRRQDKEDSSINSREKTSLEHSRRKENNEDSRLNNSRIHVSNLSASRKRQHNTENGFDDMSKQNNDNQSSMKEQPKTILKEKDKRQSEKRITGDIGESMAPVSTGKGKSVNKIKQLENKPRFADVHVGNVLSEKRNVHNKNKISNVNKESRYDSSQVSNRRSVNKNKQLENKQQLDDVHSGKEVSEKRNVGNKNRINDVNDESRTESSQVSKGKTVNKNKELVMNKQLDDVHTGKELSVKRNIGNKNSGFRTPDEFTDGVRKTMGKGKLSSNRVDTEEETGMRNIALNHRTSFGHREITINETSSVPKRPAGRKVQADQTSTMAKKKKTGTSFGPAQTIMVWSKEESKRQKSDLVDVDVVLNMVTEELESQIDLCDSAQEQRAVRMLEKYLTQDITSMAMSLIPPLRDPVQFADGSSLITAQRIQNVQNIKNLQKQARKSRQDVKQKKTQLLFLQQQTAELQEQGQTNRHKKESSSNIKQINSFLKDLQGVINMC